MAWSYSGNPAESIKDTVRFMIGDTEENDPILSDGEILYLLGESDSNVLHASLRAVDAILAKFAKYIDESVGGVSLPLSQKYRSYQSLQAVLKQRLYLEGIVPFAGGIDKPLVFSREMMTNESEVASGE